MTVGGFLNQALIYLATRFRSMVHHPASPLLTLRSWLHKMLPSTFHITCAPANEVATSSDQKKHRLYWVRATSNSLGDAFTKKYTM